MGDTNLFAHNMHKPCLAQHAAFLTKLNSGDAEWLREKFYPLQAFVNCYHNHYRNQATGLYYWQTDETIGVDNDPSTFYRPDASSGSILLNCLMYRELLAMVYLSERLNEKEIGNSYQKMADDILRAIREHCWDPKDGFYYSVDLNLRPYQRPKKAWELHEGGPRTWDCLIQRLGVWSGFLSLWSGTGPADRGKELPGHKHVQCPVRRPDAVAAGENVRRAGDGQSELLAGADLDQRELSHVSRAGEIRLHG
jgi:putative isomerase